MCQGIEIWKYGKTHSKGASAENPPATGHHSRQNSTNLLHLIDYERALRMTGYGTVVFGVTSFFWYKWLDVYLVSLSTKLQVFCKVALDEFIYAPFCITSLFGILSALEGKNFGQIKEKIQADFWPTFRVDLVVWPILQTINFYLLPLKYRVLYISVCSLFWNVFLSSMHNKTAQEQEITHVSPTKMLEGGSTGDAEASHADKEKIRRESTAMAAAELSGVGLTPSSATKEEQV